MRKYTQKSSHVQSIINKYCADWRDQHTQKGKNDQKIMYGKCMAQDCVQSLELAGAATGGCRFMDGNKGSPNKGFCYAWDSAQKWYAKAVHSTMDFHFFFHILARTAIAFSIPNMPKHVDCIATLYLYLTTWSCKSTGRITGTKVLVVLVQQYKY